MKKKQNSEIKRRSFIRTSATIVTGVGIGIPALTSAPAIIKHYNKEKSIINGVQIGVITYSFRSMKDQSAEATLEYVKDCGISAIELMGDPAEMYAGKPENPVDRRAYFTLIRQQRQGNELTQDQEDELAEMKAQMDAYNSTISTWRASVSMDPFIELKNIYKNAGVEIYAFKPSAFGKNNTDAEVDFGFRAAKALGASHVTLEHPSDDLHTLKLGKYASIHKIKVAYHGHEQQTPTLWDTALDQSPFNAMNLDLGHYIAAGNPDPRILIKAKHDRISSMHLKDRTTPENGKSNLAWGQGDTPIISVLQLMRDNKYKFPATVELEYEIPDDSNAVKEVGNCLKFCTEALQS